jgi:hypothetical protein
VAQNSSRVSPTDQPALLGRDMVDIACEMGDESRECSGPIKRAKSPEIILFESAETLKGGKVSLRRADIAALDNLHYGD